MVKLSMQHGMSDASALAFGFWDLSSARSFTVTVRVINSPSLPATSSTSTALSPTGQKVYHAMGIVAFWTQPIGDRDRFHAGDLSRRG